MTQKNKTNWKLLGIIGGICAAPFTGGTSLGWTAAALAGGGLVAGSVLERVIEGDDKEDNRQANQQANLALQNQASQKIQEEINKLREEREKQEAKNKKNEDQLHDFKQKLANRRPRAEHETDDYLKKQIAILQVQLDNDKSESKKITKKIDDLLKTMPKGNGSTWTLPDLLEMKTSTKIVIAGSVILLAYLLLSKDKEKKDKK